MIRIDKTALAFLERLYETAPDKVALRFIKRGQSVVKQHTRLGHVLFLKSGIAKCFMTEENGKDFNQEFFGEGEVIGELEAIHGGLTISNVTATTDVSVYTIRVSEFNLLLETNPEFNKLIISRLAEKVRYTAIRASHQNTYTTEHNLLYLLKLFPDAAKLIPKKDLANYLGITVRSLNRTLLKLKEQDLIQ